MKDTTRSRVAATLIAASQKRAVDAIFDYDRRKYRWASVRVVSGRVDGFDYDTRSYFAGNNSSTNKLHFFDYETSSYVDLTVNGNSFSGYDYKTGSYFSGDISGGLVSLYDYATGRYYSYVR